MEQISLPRAIDPNKFAAVREPEITALCDAVKAVLGDKYGVAGLPRHLRRRTRSHNSYTHRRRPNAVLQPLREQLKAAPPSADVPADSATPAPAAATPATYNNRAMRRRTGLLQAQFAESCRWTEASLEPSDGPARRLETHLWHAKRSTMVARWGWVLPDGEPGCGRGERAFARRVAGGAVAHDASYWCPIQLSGPPGAVRAVLHQVVDPADAAAIAQQCGGQRGWERQAVLHHAGRFPGAAISPAQVMHLPAAAIEGPSSGVLLCVWVHGAASAEAHGALVQAAASVEGAGVQVLDLRRLEVRGSGASLAIASIVEGYGSAALPAALRGLQPGGAAHLVLPDPRLSKAVEMGEERASVLEGLPPPTALRLLQPNVRAPLGEASVSALRQALRRSMLCLDTAAADDAEAEGAQQGEMLQRQVEQGATHFPALLVRQRTGWSVVLPAGWALPVWQCLVFASCRAAGQREWRWLHTLQGAPFFPHDAPDTRAYASLAAQLGAEWQQEMAGRPKGKRVSSAALRAPDWQALAAPGLLDSSAAAAPSAHAAGAAIAAEPPPLDGYFVARSEATVAAALWGVAHGAQALSPPHAARPVGNALAAGTLRWRPRQAAPAGAELCLVQALLHPVKRGLVADAAEVCVVLGREADQTTQTCYLQPAGGQPPAPAGQEPPSTAAIDPAALRTIGFVCSPALHGMPRTAPSLAVCSAAALWRLRALQHYAPRRDRGALHAWLRNPGSAALFPVQLSLPIEHN